MRLGIARALLEFDASLRPKLKWRGCSRAMRRESGNAKKYGSGREEALSSFSKR